MCWLGRFVETVLEKAAELGWLSEKVRVMLYLLQVLRWILETGWI